ncbi:MAG: DUF5615 family PIN-like protein [Candidatus Pacearchaeota archaeon]|jgi:predicted nuclease of predicted toxin-antitoxin system
MVKFLIDENVHRGLYFFLKDLGYDVILSPKGIMNGQVFRLSLSEERILITRDSDFSKNPLLSSKHSGIILIKISPEDIESQKSSLLKLFEKVNNFESCIISLYKDRFDIGNITEDL